MSDVTTELANEANDKTMQIARLKAENAKLRELAAQMAEALRVGGEWCDRECIVVFGCDGMDECPIAKELRELGVEVD